MLVIVWFASGGSIGGNAFGGSDAGNAGGSASSVVPDRTCVWLLPKTGRANGGATVALGGSFDDLASMSLRSFDRVSKLSVFALCFVRRLLTGDGRLENMNTTPQ
jgi:hypothetical protein